ncbi:DUF996 domain-containing protein [Pyrococcus yayanosii]|uniref:DUF996 domain-containing protein n=1 Tax=Pyrococcus yayanosii (strain CH1 / JCM 16557) TaxID=529709 RepID=F8AEU2_PYRYC|nr:DUF996 domain-containing protein [Pyrococcus yayanosii]AEH24774.1 hypothetical protein PYCH_10930 [Pyrococcus yayanosii CH1]
MVYLADVRNSGLEGNVLLVVGGLLQVGGLIGKVLGSLIQLAGLLMLYSAVRGFAERSGRESAKNNFLKSLLIGIGGTGLWLVLIAKAPTFRSGLATYFYAMGTFAIVLIASMYFERRVWMEFFYATRTEKFRDAANLLWYGALLSFLIIGFFIGLVGRILLILAFADMPRRIEGGERPQWTL